MVALRSMHLFGGLAGLLAAHRVYVIRCVLGCVNMQNPPTGFHATTGHFSDQRGR